MRFLEELGKPNAILPIFLLIGCASVALFWLGGFDEAERLALLAVSLFSVSGVAGCVFSRRKGGE